VRDMRGHLALAACLLAGLATGAGAQTPEPIGIFAADARVVFPRYPEDPAIATDIGADPDSLPGRGLGLAFGAHVYPFRLGIVTFGFGAEWLTSRGRGSTPVADANDPDEAVDGPEVETRLSSFSPQISLNFGGRQGWSYLTGGLGRGTLSTQFAELPLTDPEAVRVLNYGGGARWFAKEHVALSLDLRFYSVGGQAAVGTRPAYPKSRMMVLSAGVSLK
jgi:hypothetical protein